MKSRSTLRRSTRVLTILLLVLHLGWVLAILMDFPRVAWSLLGVWWVTGFFGTLYMMVKS